MMRFLQVWLGRLRGEGGPPDDGQAPDADGDHPHFFGDLRIHEALRAAGIPGSYTIESAWETLGYLDGAQLLAVDQAVRTSMPQLGATDDRMLFELADAVESDDQAAAYRFAAACSSNVYIRQQAVLDLSKTRTRLGLAAGLIRARDPVPVLREAAADLVLAQLWDASAVDALSLQDLHEHLQQREGVARGDWVERLGVILRASAGSDAGTT